MPTLSENISGAIDLAGAVSSPKTPNLLGKTGRIINQIARTMMREARLSDQNQYLKFLTLTSPSKEQAIPSITDPNSICTVELSTDLANDVRMDIPIVGRMELNASPYLACARFGRPTRIRFTWNPSTEPISGCGADTIYVGYENLASDADQMSSVPNMPESFHDVLQYRTAALIKETILKETNGPVFLDTMKTIERQWQDWCSRDAEERPYVKPGFGSLDVGDYNEVWWY
jgi:hypothetical protein